MAHTGGLDPDGAARANEVAYAASGPYAVGVTTVEIEPRREMEVWYPVDPVDTAGLTPASYHVRDFITPTLDQLIPPEVDPEFVTAAFSDVAPAAGADRPLVLFSHGAMSFRLQSTVLTSHLASWGFIVMSPDYFERGLQSLFGNPPAFTRSSSSVTELAMDAAMALDADGPLAGQIDTSELFPIGHSAGGSQSTALAGERTDVHSWIALASGVSLTPSLFNLNPTVPESLSDPDKTVMWVGGRNDGVARLPGIETAFAYSAGEKKLVTIPGAGHNNAFSDLCEIGREQGGLIGLATSGGLPLPDFAINLARDGCVAPPNFLSPDVWPVVNHFVTAELRYRSGLDADPVGLGTGVVTGFGPVTPTYEHVE
jgi:dienelactone hydrolase